VLFDTEKLRQAARRAKRSCRRHPLAALAGVALVVGTGSVSWLAAPLKYQSTAVVSARPDEVSSAIANPSRTVPQGSDKPLANARDTILGEANIDRIITDAHLIEHQQAHVGETSLGEFRRSVFQAAGLAGQAQDEEKAREALRTQLRQVLMVQIDGGSNGPDRLTISVLWDDPEDARAIVTAAQATVLEDRHTSDLGPINAALDILERYKADAADKVAELRKELNFPSTEIRDLPEGSPLRSALQSQADLADRLNSARIEVDAAEAAFEYRYTVVQTPEVPRGPVSSMLKRYAMTAALAMVAAVGLATARAGFRRRSAAARAAAADVAAAVGSPLHSEVGAHPVTPDAPAAAPRPSDARRPSPDAPGPGREAHQLDDPVHRWPATPVPPGFDPTARPRPLTASAGSPHPSPDHTAFSWAPPMPVDAPGHGPGNR
jgi:hypothetical protein